MTINNIYGSIKAVMSKLMNLYEQRLLNIRNRIFKNIKTDPEKQNQIGDFIFYYSKDKNYFSFTHSDVDVSLMRALNPIYGLSENKYSGYQMELKFENYNAWSTFLFSRWMDEIEETILLILKHQKIN